MDRTKLVDGDHVLTVVAHPTAGREGVRQIPFRVRNAPAISVTGLTAGDTILAVIPMTVSANGSERSDSFVVSASEMPKPIQVWGW